MAFRDGAPYRALVTAFDGVDLADPDDAARRAHRLLSDDRWVGDLIAPLVAALAADPWFEPPFRVSRDALRIGAILFDCPAVTISVTVLSADALAHLPPPNTVVVPGRLSIVRYVRGGGARLRLWHAGVIDETFSAATARPAVPLGVLPLGDGVVLRLDGRARGSLLEGAQSDVVTLTASIRAGAAPVMREYDCATGNLRRAATLDDGASRAQMLLSFLRLAGRHDAGDCFDAATRDPATFLRWAAMREWLALDAAAALPRLREMTGDDHGEIRSAATATLGMVEAQMVARTCPA